MTAHDIGDLHRALIAMAFDLCVSAVASKKTRRACEDFKLVVFDVDLDHDSAAADIDLVIQCDHVHTIATGTGPIDFREAKRCRPGRET